MKVLLIDDSSLSKKMILRVFEAVDAGIDGIEANGGQDGIELFDKERPDIVFCDLLMPDMDGMEVAKKIRKINKDVFLVILSSDAQEERQKEALNAGVNLFLKKPLDLKKMEHCLTLYNDNIDKNKAKE